MKSRMSSPGVITAELLNLNFISSIDCEIAVRVFKPQNCLPTELHHFSSLSFFNHLFSVLIYMIL